MPLTQHEQLKLRSRPSNEFLATIPIKKRHFLFTRPTSPPQGLPTLNDHKVNENKNELLELESSYVKAKGKLEGTLPIEGSGIFGNKPETTIISKSQDNSVGLANHVDHCEFSAVVDGHMYERKSAFSDMASLNTTDDYISTNPDMAETKHENLEPGSSLQINSFTGKHASKGTSKESFVNESRDLNIALPFTVIEEGSTNKLVAISKDGNSGVQENVLENNCSRIVSSSNMQVFEVQGKFSGDEFFMKQEEHSDKLKENSSHTSMNRLNWDLNTPMDAWEGTMESSLLSNGIVENECHEGVKFDTFELGFKQILSDEPNGTDRKNLLPLQNPVNRNSETCLDLQLKPLSNSCSTLRKLNVNSEMSFLSLGTNPTSCTSEPQSNTSTVVKSEPVKRLVEVQTQHLKTPDLNQVKIEPTEAHEISKTAVLDNSNLVSSKLTMKLEPLDGIRQANQISCKTSDEISNLTPQPSTSHNCTNSSNLNLSNNTSDTVKNVKLLVDRALLDANTLDMIPKSSNPDKDDTHSTSEACENSNLPSTEILQSLTSTLIAQHSSNSTLTDDVYKKMSEDSKVDESDEVDYKAGIEELCDTTTCNSGNSQVNTGVERSGNYNEDNITAEVSCEATKLQPKTSNSVSSTDCPKESNSLDASKLETSVSSVGKTRKLIGRPVNDVSNEGKGIERNLKTNYSSSKTISSDNQIDEQNTIQIVLDKEVTLKESNDRADQRIIYLNTALEKRNYTSDRPLLSGETKRPAGESFRTDTFYEKSRNFENGRHYGHQIENSRFDTPHGKARAEQSNTSKFSKQSGKQDFDDERQNLTRFPYQIQRRSPISHYHSVRGISPKDRLTRREAHDFAQPSREETQYERTRERTSFSPPLRRSRPLQLPPRRTITQWSPSRRSSNEFSGHRSRSPQPVRIPCYQQERISNRRMDVGPPREDDYPRSVRVSNKNIHRFHTIADPREVSEEDNEEYFDQIREFDNDENRRCDERHGGPNSEFENDEKFIDDRRCNERHGGPNSEFENDEKFINDRRCNERRGGPIREFDNDEKFIDDRRCNGRRGGPIREFDNDEKFIDDRRCNERRDGPIRENTQYHDEDGTNPRDFDSRFRYRLGNSSGRFRGFIDDQEDNYRIREEQEWHDSRTRFGDTKIKRRRF